jgi:hypothetical protein
MFHAAHGMTDLQVRMVGMHMMGRALLLIAAAQSSFFAQKRALQYNMVAVLATVFVWVVALDVYKDKMYIPIAAALMDLGASIWACYYYHEKEEEETEEEN